MRSIPADQVAEMQLHITATGVFSDLDPQQLADLDHQGIYMEYRDELVTADGDTPGYFFFIIQGTFEVDKLNVETKKKTVLAAIGKGECFGEMSFFTSAPASANVVAIGQVICWAIPHNSLRDFISSHPGGACLAIQIASLLARRVQQGNARLLNMNSTLSAYFGNMARTSSAHTLESPRSNEPAEMEIPEDVFDQFVHENLSIPENKPLTTKQRQTVRQQIENNQIDIVPWLESKRGGDPLKMRLKFVAETAAPRAQTKVDVVRPFPPSATPMVVRVPQVRAQVAAPIPYAPPPTPSSSIWKWAYIALFALLPFLTAYVIFAMMPLESRESIAASSQFKKFQLRGLANFFLFRKSSQSTDITLAAKESHELAFSAPKPVRISGQLKLSKKLSVPAHVRVRVGDENETSKKIVDQTIDLTINGEATELFSIFLPPGSYMVECLCDEGWPSGVSLPAKLIVTARY